LLTLAKITEIGCVAAKPHVWFNWIKLNVGVV